MSDIHVYVADFGLARVLSANHVIGTRTTRVGTPGFQAPEQLRAQAIDELQNFLATVPSGRAL